MDQFKRRHRILASKVTSTLASKSKSTKCRRRLFVARTGDKQKVADFNFDASVDEP